MHMRSSTMRPISARTHRAVRREYNELFKGMQKDGDITEDDLKRVLDQVQSETNGGCARVDDLVKLKEVEILEV